MSGHAHYTATVGPQDGIPTDAYLELAAQAARDCAASAAQVVVTIEPGADARAVELHLHALIRAFRAQRRPDAPLAGVQPGASPIARQLALDAATRRHLLACASSTCAVRVGAVKALRGEGCSRR